MDVTWRVRMRWDKVVAELNARSVSERELLGSDAISCC